jgi:hypothetical protein
MLTSWNYLLAFDLLALLEAHFKYSMFVDENQ